MIENQEGEDRIARAILELRNEPAPHEPRAKLLEAMRRGPRRAHPVRWVMAGATAGLCLAVVLLWPQQRALAWSQVVAATRANTKFHTQSFQLSPDGSTWTLVGEVWVDGVKRASEFLRPAPSQFPATKMILRRDGKRFFMSPIGFNGAANVGIVADIKSKQPPMDFSKRFSIESFLNSKWLTFDGQPEHTQLDGKDVLRYTGTTKGRDAGRTVVYADPMTGVMVREESYDGAGRLNAYMVIQVLDSIPASQFEPPPGIKLIDADVEHAKLETIMSHGIPFGEGNVLRALLGDGHKYLTLEWTGEHPNADGMPCAHIEGYKALRVSSTSNFGLLPDGRAARSQTYQGRPLYSLYYVLDKPVGKFVNLDVPVLVPDHSKPIVDRDGKLVGYWPKKIGVKRLLHVSVHDVWNVGGNL